MKSKYSNGGVIPNQVTDIKFTPYIATAYAEGFEEAPSKEAVYEAWAYLIATKQAYSLQGWFGRQAEELINNGLIERDGTINWDAIDEMKNGGAFKQLPAQYDHKKYGDGDKSKKAKPVGYRYKNVEKTSKLYYKTPSAALINKFEKGDESAREKIYFERRKDHSDKSLSGRTFSSGGAINMDKHIWEGWTVGAFIDDLKIPFQYHPKFKSRDEVKKWAMNEQPYYKKYIPEVVDYFWNENENKYYKGGGVGSFPFIKFEDAQEAIKKVNKGELPKFFSYVEKEKTLYYLPNITGEWVKLESFETKEEAIEWVKNNLKSEGFAKGGEFGGVVKDLTTLNAIAKKYSLSFDRRFKYYDGDAYKNSKGESLPHYFTHKGRVFELKYYSGSFNPFLIELNPKHLVYRKDTHEPAFMNYPNPKWDTSKYYVKEELSNGGGVYGEWSKEDLDEEFRYTNNRINNLSERVRIAEDEIKEGLQESIYNKYANGGGVGDKDKYIKLYNERIDKAIKDSIKETGEAPEDSWVWIAEEGDFTAEEIAGYYLQEYKDEALSTWLENVKHTIGHDTDEKVTQILKVVSGVSHAKGGGVSTIKERVIDYYINNSDNEDLINLMGVSDVPNLKQVAEKWVNNRDTYYDKIFSAIDGIHNRTWAENKFEELGLEKFSNGGGVRTSNKDSRSLVLARTPFNANNLSGEFIGDVFVVKSYGYYPVFVYKKGKWYENSNKYSKSTAKQMGQARPTSDAELLDTEELKALYGYEEGGSIESDLQSMENSIQNQLASDQRLSVDSLEMYLGRKPNYEENIVGYKIRKCYLQPYFKRIS